MRYVDIYRDDILIASDCIQLGHPELNRTPNVKKFTMADGAPCMYAAAKDTAMFTLQLECNAENAKKIANAARFGCLTFAGMSYGTNRQSLPEQSGVIGYITGAVQTQEISGKADIYTVKIPLQLQVDASGEIEPVSVPAIKVFSLVIGGHGESLTDANYHYYPGGTFIRKRTISWKDSSISFSCNSRVPDSEELYTTIERESTGILLTGGDSLSGSLPLEKGNNTFILTVRKKEGANYKAQIIRFSVFRIVPEPEPEIPDDYELLEAILSPSVINGVYTGRNIQLFYCVKENTKIVIDYTPLLDEDENTESYTRSYDLYVSGNALKGINLQVYYMQKNYPDGRIYCRVDGKTTSVSDAPVVGERYTVTAEKNYCRFDSDTGHNIMIENTNYFQYNSSIGTLNILGQNSASGLHGIVYSAKVYEDEEIVFDLYPVKKKATSTTDELIGFYDAVNGGFYNLGNYVEGIPKG